MHIAPFHFKVDNEFCKLDVLGYLAYKPSRRNKRAFRVYLNVGDGSDFICEVLPKKDPRPGWFTYDISYDYHEMFVRWMEMHAKDEEYLNTQMPGADRSPAYLDQFLRKRGAVLRFW